MAENGKIPPSYLDPKNEPLHMHRMHFHSLCMRWVINCGRFSHVFHHKIVIYAEKFVQKLCNGRDGFPGKRKKTRQFENCSTKPNIVASKTLTLSPEMLVLCVIEWSYAKISDMFMIMYI